MRNISGIAGMYAAVLTVCTLFVPSFLLASHPSANSAECETPLFDGMGDFHFEITTNSDLAQRYFNQGMVLAYGFNHAEAERSFRKAAELDSYCAMCNWGIAYVLGPNINKPMERSDEPEAISAVERAQVLARLGTERERDYIAAMSKRYIAASSEQRSDLDAAYAAAMEKLSLKYPNDHEAAVIFAEALMDTMPWNYWNEEKQPRPATVNVLSTLERVLKSEPNHVGANHFYIHAVESVYPKAGEAAADRLNGLVPGAGHLLHMPSHIYIRIGRYHDGSAVNERAIAADRAYLQQCHAPGFYEAMYIPHNIDFLIATASLEGRSDIAVQSAKELRTYVEGLTDHMQHDVTHQQFWANHYLALVRFDAFDLVLQEPAPGREAIYALGLWHYARAIAFSSRGEGIEARKEIIAIEKALNHHSLENAKIMGLNSASSILSIGLWEARGLLAFAEGENSVAVAHLRKAIEIQDSLVYIEPPAWFRPVRWVLGQVLLQMGNGTEAENEFRADLELFPENGWSLLGLAKTLEAQGRAKEASSVYAQHLVAWSRADVRVEGMRIFRSEN